MWLLYAFGAAICAALVAIFGKLGLKSIDSTLATTIRGIIMAGFLVFVSLTMGKFNGFHFNNLDTKDWVLISLSGVAGAMSWLFYFMALKVGDASRVVAIDRLSIVFVIILAGIFLAEGFSWKSVTGAILMVGGAILISLK